MGKLNQIIKQVLKYSSAMEDTPFEWENVRLLAPEVYV